MGEPSFARVKEVLAIVRELEPDAREAHLRRECRGDEPLRAEVLSLLEEESRVSGFLEPPTGLRGLIDPLGDPGEVTPEAVGPFRIVRRIASGGMGSVFEAEQDSPRRRVALKMIRSGAISEELLRRFQLETELLGRLRHPGIAQVYHASTANVGRGVQPYFAMEYVEGVSLTRYARGQSVRSKLELFVRICDAVQHAHQKGVVHRDLKPANILVTEEDGHGGAAQPKILDFGIARATDADVKSATVQTSIGQLVGTVPYMSPEQVVGDGREIDTRSDVYALGVVLFELLARRLPYDLEASTVPEAARIICEEEPQRLSSIDLALRGDLDTIAGKALEKEPDRRYASAAELAADVRRFLNDEPILARPASTFYQLKKFARRNRSLVAGFLVAIAALLIALVVSIRFGVREARLRAVAEAREDAARFATYCEALVAAQATALLDPPAAARALERAPEELRSWEWHLLRARLDAHQQNFRVSPPNGTAPLGETGHPEVVGDVAFDAEDAALFAYAGESGIELVDLAEQEPRLLVPGVEGVRAVALAPSQGLLGVAQETGLVAVWKLIRATGGGGWILGQPVCEVPMEFPPTALEFSADGSVLGVLVKGAWVGAFTIPEGEPIYSLKGPGMMDMALWPDGRRMVVGRRQPHGVDILRPGGQERVAYQARAVAVSSSGSLYAAANDFGVDVRHTEGGETEVRLGGGNLGPVALSFSEDETHLAAVGVREVKIWELDSGELVSSQQSPQDGTFPKDLHFTSDALVARTGLGATLCRAEVEEFTLLDWDWRAQTVTFSRDGHWLALAGGLKAAVVDMRTNQRIADLETSTRVSGVSFDSDRTRLFAKCLGPEYLRWDAPGENGNWGASTSVDAAEWTAAISGVHITAPRTQASWTSRDGKLQVQGKAGGGFELVELPSQRLVAAGTPADTSESWVPSVSVSTDGRWVVTGERDGALRFWDGRTGRELGSAQGHRSTVQSLDFHPHLPRLASAGGDGKIMIWDVERRTPILTLRAHGDQVDSICFSPDGSQLVSASKDSTIRLWDTLSSREGE